MDSLRTDSKETTESNKEVPTLLTSIHASNQNKTIPKSLDCSLPYHYSECDKLYVCNLCNCTYDSLRSIKAHLWKHSGHRELSYPIHDYKDKENNNKKSNKKLSTDTYQSKLTTFKIFYC